MTIAASGGVYFGALKHAQWSSAEIGIPMPSVVGCANTEANIKIDARKLLSAELNSFTITSNKVQPSHFNHVLQNSH